MTVSPYDLKNSKYKFKYLAELLKAVSVLVNLEIIFMQTCQLVWQLVR
jgi:hypothetical protein